MTTQGQARQQIVVNVAAGEHYVTSRDDVVISTVLGSCVAACIRDPHRSIGGMNHFMLPSSPDGAWNGANASLRYGNYAMERLINEILRHGGHRGKLEVKIFGGGDVLRNVSPVGHRNAEFVECYLRNENIPIAAHDLRGSSARLLRYRPGTGQVLMKRVPIVAARAKQPPSDRYQDDLAMVENGGSVELFD